MVAAGRVPANCERLQLEIVDERIRVVSGHIVHAIPPQLACG